MASIWRACLLMAWCLSGLGLAHSASPSNKFNGNDLDRTGPSGGDMALASVSSPADVEIGRRVYTEGIGANGQPLTGLRFGGIEARGKDVACSNCHRRSGLGAVEGTNLVPPIAGRYIFHDSPRAAVSMNFRNIKNFNQRHAPFTDDTFAQAMNQGMHPDGHEYSLIMPRFDLKEAELRGLKAYLNTLSAEWSPGVSASRLRFATVITPDVTPERKKIFLDTIQAAVAQKNGNVVQGMRTMSSAAEMLFHSDRRWELEVWELQGPPETWSAQLQRWQADKPVFALVSGLGAGQWAPVHQFCENQKLPCWFPSVDAPPANASSDFYSVYFSSGVTLEADVLAEQLRTNKPARLLQITLGDDAGLAGAKRLQATLANLRIKLNTETRSLKPGDDKGLRTLLSSLGANDAVMLWWPATQSASLQDQAVPKAQVYVSGRLLGAKLSDMPDVWKGRVKVLYPYQLPEKRFATLFYFQSWLKVRKLSLQDEALQSEVYFAMSYLGETLIDMIDNVHRDYLLERAENGLSLREGQKAEDEARELTVARHNKAVGGAQGAMSRLAMQPETQKVLRPMPGRPEQTAIRREGTSVYPRMGLGPGQRFASKGAYVVTFDATDHSKVVPLTEWIVP